MPTETRVANEASKVIAELQEELAAAKKRIRALEKKLALRAVKTNENKPGK